MCVTYSYQQVHSWECDRAPASPTVAVCVCVCVFLSEKKRICLPNRMTTPTVSATGGILGILKGHPLSPARSLKVICYKHMTHLDSLDYPNESK